MNRSRLSNASLGAVSDEASRVPFVWALEKENPAPAPLSRNKIAPRHQHQLNKRSRHKARKCKVRKANMQRRHDVIKEVAILNMGLSIDSGSVEFGNRYCHSCNDRENEEESMEGREDFRMPLMPPLMPIMEEDKNAKGDESSELLSLPNTNETDESEARSRRSSITSSPRMNEASASPEQVDKEKENNRLVESECKRMHGIAAICRRHLVDQSKQRPSLSFQTGNVHLDLDSPCPSQSSRSQSQHEHPQQRQPRWQRGIHRNISSFLKKSSTSNNHHKNSLPTTKTHPYQSGVQKENSRALIPNSNSDQCQKQEHPPPYPHLSQQPNTMSSSLQKDGRSYANINVGAPNYREEASIALPHTGANHDDDISSISSMQNSEPNMMSSKLQKNARSYYANISVGAPSCREKVSIALPHTGVNHDDDISSISSMQNSEPNMTSSKLQKNGRSYYANISVGAPNYREEVSIALPHTGVNRDDDISSISSMQNSLHSLTIDASFSNNANNDGDRKVPPNIDRDQKVRDDIRDAQEPGTSNVPRRPGTNTTFQMHECDGRGRCVRHRHIRLRRKKFFGLGGWKVLLSACPDCCAEELHRMYYALEDKIRELSLDGGDG